MWGWRVSLQQQNILNTKSTYASRECAWWLATLKFFFNRTGRPWNLQGAPARASATRVDYEKNKQRNLHRNFVTYNIFYRQYSEVPPISQKATLMPPIILTVSRLIFRRTMVCPRIDAFMNNAKLEPSKYSTWTAHWPQKCNRGNRKRGQSSSVKKLCPFLSFFYWLKGFSMEGVQDCNTQNKNHGKVCKYLVL